MLEHALDGIVALEQLAQSRRVTSSLPRITPPHSLIPVGAILKAVVMKQKLKGYMWCGVLVNTAAMVLVGSTSFFTADVDSSARDPRCDNPMRRERHEV